MGMGKDVFDEYGNYKYPDYANTQYTHDVSTTGGVMMEMTVEEHIAQLKKLKSFHNGSYGASVRVAIGTMRKYQQIEEIYKEWFSDAGRTSADAYSRIGEVLKDGKIG